MSYIKNIKGFTKGKKQREKTQNNKITIQKSEIAKKQKK